MKNFTLSFFSFVCLILMSSFFTIGSLNMPTTEHFINGNALLQKNLIIIKYGNYGRGLILLFK